ncbi:hypothetical protein JW968_07180 [Candidatus Woesearchaeota archaeon]|nr:hypothetical protein [Candidatus Woesearchaeota archaeon]
MTKIRKVYILRHLKIGYEKQQKRRSENATEPEKFLHEQKKKEMNKDVFIKSTVLTSQGINLEQSRAH